MIRPLSEHALWQAAQLIAAGKLVAFPTETVYGLGADASNSQAIERLFTVKGRPHYNPLIIHVDSIAHARKLAYFDTRAETLAQAFWPGPLTIILPYRLEAGIVSTARAGLSTIALRCPAHPIARAIVARSRQPIAAPSANSSGCLSPTRAKHVYADLASSLDLILDGGPTEFGIESTILDLTEYPARLLRPGVLSLEDLAPYLHIEQACSFVGLPKAPGGLSHHYAPQAALRLVSENMLFKLAPPQQDEACLAFGPHPPDHYPILRNLSFSGNLAEAAARLFDLLHDLDQPDKVTVITAMKLPDHGIGCAINDRLKRAATFIIDNS